MLSTKKRNRAGAVRCLVRPLFPVSLCDRARWRRAAWKTDDRGRQQQGAATKSRSQVGDFLQPVFDLMLIWCSTY